MKEDIASTMLQINNVCMKAGDVLVMDVKMTKDVRWIVNQIISPGNEDT